MHIVEFNFRNGAVRQLLSQFYRGEIRVLEEFRARNLCTKPWIWGVMGMVFESKALLPGAIPHPCLEGKGWLCFLNSYLVLAFDEAL